MDITPFQSNNHAHYNYIAILTLITPHTFQAMLAMELELRKHLQPQQPPNLHKVTEHILKNEDVQFHWCIHWCIVASDWEEEETEALLQLVVNMWITIRGFSYGWRSLSLHMQNRFRSQKDYERS